MIRSVLVCHDSEPLNRLGLALWLASFTQLAAIVEIHEPKGRLWKRVRREWQRVGVFRFLDVLAFRVYSAMVLRSEDRNSEEQLLNSLKARFQPLSPSTRVLRTSTPNSAETERLLEQLCPDVIVARCKIILQRRIFERAKHGTLVMHPGICPEYRNAHGCFWALARGDCKRVGMTLLKADDGVDTGPVYGYYACQYNEAKETHTMIQHRMVFDNLDALRAKIEDIVEGTARPIDTRGRESKVWGQPWLSAYLRWKIRARRKQVSR